MFQWVVAKEYAYTGTLMHSYKVIDEHNTMNDM